MAKQPTPRGKEAPKDKDVLAPSKEDVPQTGKDEKQTTIPDMDNPWVILPSLEIWWILPLLGMERRRISRRKRLWPRIRASRRIKRRMRPSPAGVAHQRLTSRPPTGLSRNLGTKYPKVNRLPGKLLSPRRRPRLQPSSRSPLGMHPWRERGDCLSQSFQAATRPKIIPLHPSDAKMQGLVESVKAAGVNQPALVCPLCVYRR